MKTLVLAAVAATLALPAAAGGLASPAPEPAPFEAAPVPLVSGADWTGGYVGAQLGYGDVSGGLSGDGALGGVHAGYRQDFGGFVLGGEIDHDVADISLGGNDTLDSVTRLKLSAGADLGRTLLYATVGGAQARADVGGASLSDSGWLGGVGVAYQVNDNWVLGGEILTHRFDDFDNSGVDLDANTATLRASFRF
jgi:opacity protein-like surface antigen